MSKTALKKQVPLPQPTHAMVSPISSRRRPPTSITPLAQQSTTPTKRSSSSQHQSHVKILFELDDENDIEEIMPPPPSNPRTKKLTNPPPKQQPYMNSSNTITATTTNRSKQATATQKSNHTINQSNPHPISNSSNNNNNSKRKFNDSTPIKNDHHRSLSPTPTRKPGQEPNPNIRKKLRISELESLDVKPSQPTSRASAASATTPTKPNQYTSTSSSFFTTTTTTTSEHHTKQRFSLENGLSLLRDQFQFATQKDHQQYPNQRKRSLDSDGFSEISFKPTKKPQPSSPSPFNNSNSTQTNASTTTTTYNLSNELESVTSERFEFMEGPRERSRALWIFNSVNFLERLTENPLPILGSREFKTGDSKTWSIDLSYDSKSETISISLRRVSNCTGEQVVQVTAKMWVVSQQNHETLERSATSRKRFAGTSTPATIVQATTTTTTTTTTTNITTPTSTQPDTQTFSFPLDVEVVLEKYQHIVFSITIVPLRLLNYSSRYETGFVGIENEGMTCYINSFLQTLFHLKPFVKLIYAFPTHAPQAPTFPHSLQKLFYDLQTNPSHCSTADLLKSFSWDRSQAKIQQDIQEFSCLLLDFIDSKANQIKHLQGKVRDMFSGKMENYIRCSEVNYESVHPEPFIDISLSLKGFRDIYESLDDYIREETLSGDNKYDTGTKEFGRQDAKKGTRLLHLPPVLVFHLKRFEFDTSTNRNVKITDRHEYYDTIDLTKYVTQKQTKTTSNSSKQPKSTQTNPPTSQQLQQHKYRLFAVLVHTGDMSSAGHYHAFIRPNNTKHLNPSNSSNDTSNPNDHWFKFNDHIVERSSPSQVFEHSFGGSTHFKSFDKQKKELFWESAATNSTAYLLVYINENSLTDMANPIPKTFIPQWIVEEVNETSSPIAPSNNNNNILPSNNQKPFSFHTPNTSMTTTSTTTIAFTPHLQPAAPPLLPQKHFHFTTFEHLKKQQQSRNSPLLNALIFHKQSAHSSIVDFNESIVKVPKITAITPYYSIPPSQQPAIILSASLSEAISQVCSNTTQTIPLSEVTLWRIKYDNLLKQERISNITSTLTQKSAQSNMLSKSETILKPQQQQAELDILLILPLRAPSKKPIDNNNNIPTLNEISDRKVTLIIVKTAEQIATTSSSNFPSTPNTTLLQFSHYFFIKKESTFLALCSEITRILPLANLYDFHREDKYQLTPLSLDKHAKTTVKVLFNDSDAITIVAPLRNKLNSIPKTILSIYNSFNENIQITFKPYQSTTHLTTNHNETFSEFLNINSTTYTSLQQLIASKCTQRSPSEELINIHEYIRLWTQREIPNQSTSINLIELFFHTDSSQEFTLDSFLNTQSNKPSILKAPTQNEEIPLIFYYEFNTEKRACERLKSNLISCQLYDNPSNSLLVSYAILERTQSASTLSSLWQQFQAKYLPSTHEQSDSLTQINEETPNNNALETQHIRVCILDEKTNNNSNCIQQIIESDQSDFNMPLEILQAKSNKRILSLRFERVAQPTQQNQQNKNNSINIIDESKSTATMIIEENQNISFACHSSNSNGSEIFDHPFVLSVNSKISIQELKLQALSVLKNRKSFFKNTPVIINSLNELTFLVSENPRTFQSVSNKPSMILTDSMNEMSIEEALKGTISTGLLSSLQSSSETNKSTINLQITIFMEIQHSNIISTHNNISSTNQVKF